MAATDVGETPKSWYMDIRSYFLPEAAIRYWRGTHSGSLISLNCMQEWAKRNVSVYSTISHKNACTPNSSNSTNRC